MDKQKITHQLIRTSAAIFYQETIRDWLESSIVVLNGTTKEKDVLAFLSENVDDINKEIDRLKEKEKALEKEMAEAK